MSAVEILSYVATAFLVWLILMSIIICVVVVQLVNQARKSLIRITVAVENMRENLKPSNYVNPQMIGNIMKWSLGRIFNK